MKLSTSPSRLKRTCMIALFGMAIILRANAQNPNPIPKNPEAAALAKSLDYPANNSTGTPNIGIPLFNVSNGELNYSVKLNYQGGGIRVGQMPTWVGLNWSMNAAPQITRTINGRDDILTTGYLNLSEVGVYDVGRTRPDNFWLDYLSKNQVDEQPDEFNYSLMNKSGKFFYQKYNNNTFKAMPVPYDQLDIQYDKITQTYTMVDIDGTKYFFGGTGCTESTHMAGGNVAITAWKCNMIVSPNKKDTITYEYYNKQNKYRGIYSEKVEIYDLEPSLFGNACPIPFTAINPDITYYVAYRSNPVVMKTTSGAPYPNIDTYFLFAPPGSTYVYDFNNPNIYFDTGGYSTEPYGDTQVIENIALKKINFKGNKIEFYPKQQADEVLDSIRITNYLGQYIKTIKLTRYGLNLTEVRFSANTGNNEVYQFEYNPGGHNPEENTPSDAWGYPNQSNFAASTDPVLDFFNNSTLPYQWITASSSSDGTSVAAQSYSFPIGKNSIEPNEDDMKEGMLNKITYPSGGYTTFEFEANKYLQYGINEKLAGGVRIKSIKNYTGESLVPATEKYYKYETNGVEGMGYVIIDPMLNNFEYKEIGHWQKPNGFDYMSGAENPNFRKRTFVKNVLDNVYFSDGSPVNYETVKVYESTNGHETGYIAYNYRVHHSNTRIVNTPLTQHNLDIDNGQLLAEKYYAYIGGSFELIKSKEYTYETYLLPDKIHVGKVFNSYPLMGDVKGISPDATYGNFMYITYGLDVGYSRLIKEVETTKEIGNLAQALETRKDYFYDNINHTYVTRTKFTNSSGEEINEYTSYPQDFVGESGMITSLLANHKFNQVIESVVAKKSPTTSILNGKINLFENSTENYYKKTLVLENDAPVLLSSFKFANSLAATWPENSAKQVLTSDSRYKEKISFDQYDSHGNIVQITSKTKQIVSYVWSYKGSYPVIEIKNLDYNTLKTFIGATQLETFINSSPTKSELDIFVAAIKANFPNILLSYFTYQPLVGMTSQTDAKDMTTFFEYDSFQRLKFIKDQNGNIKKSYCYNYAGQTVNCGTGALLPNVTDFLAGYTTSRYEICDIGNEGAEPVLVVNLFSAGPALGIIQVIGSPEAVYYTDSSLTTLAPDGYYTINETDLGHPGYKFYYLKDGKVLFSNWCDLLDPVH